MCKLSGLQNPGLPAGYWITALFDGRIFMRQYELAIRIAQIHHLLDEHKYKKALAVVRTLDMKQIKSPSDISAIADVFAKTEQYDSAKAAYLKIYNKSKTRRVLNRLIYLAIRTHEIEDAEKYYQEFIKMYPGTRDVLILRYRIDKAAGVPIGRLIEILEELKEEEYIEEWAYELAKLYHKAGRFEECRSECEDILLWFGHGEIVERAKRLIEYVDDKEAMPYLDDKDYTMKKEEPNPDDTGSLPDLKEYLKAKSFEDESFAKRQKERDAVKQDIDGKVGNDLSSTQEEAVVHNKAKEQQDDGFIDDYDDDDFDIDADIGRIAKEGFQKLTGFLRFGSKKDNKDSHEKEDAGKAGYSYKDKENIIEESVDTDNIINNNEVYEKETLDREENGNINVKNNIARDKTDSYYTETEVADNIEKGKENIIPQEIQF